MNKLEADLAVALYDRSGQRAVLTPAGRLLLEEGRHLLAAAERLELLIKQLESGWEPVLRIARDTILPWRRCWPCWDNSTRWINRWRSA